MKANNFSDSFSKEEKLVILNSLVTAIMAYTNKALWCGDKEEYQEIQYMIIQTQELHKKLHQLWVTEQDFRKVA